MIWFLVTFRDAEANAFCSAVVVKVAEFEVLKSGLSRGLQNGFRSGLPQRLKTVQQGGERGV